MKRFRDRRDAGDHLAEVLAATIGLSSDPVVLGIPRGGVIVADLVADKLTADLDVLAVEKIGAPWNPELAVGAVGEGEVLWLDPALVGRVDSEYLERAIRRERGELREKLAAVRAVWPRVDLAGRTVIVVDDGVATGATIRAALLALEGAATQRRVLAVPVGPPETLASLEYAADDVVCPVRPASFYSVGMWYDSFDQCSQADVVEVFERRLAAGNGA